MKIEPAEKSHLRLDISSCNMNPTEDSPKIAESQFTASQIEELKKSPMPLVRQYIYLCNATTFDANVHINKVKPDKPPIYLNKTGLARPPPQLQSQPLVCFVPAGTKYLPCEVWEDQDEVTITAYRTRSTGQVVIAGNLQSRLLKINDIFFIQKHHW